MPSFPALPRRRAGSSGSVDDHARHVRRPRPESRSRSPARRDRSLRPLPRRGHRRLRRRRVRLRPRGADLARGARPDPRVRQDRHRARRRRQRRQQRRRARRRGRARSACSATTPPATGSRAALHAGVDARALARVRGRETPIKTRILAGGIHSAKQQIVRIDRGTHRRASADERRRFEQAALAATASVDARARLGLRLRPGDAAAGGRDQAIGADAEGRAAADPGRLALRPGPLPRPDRVDAERSRGRGAARRADRRRRPRARAGRPPAARATRRWRRC